MKLSKDNYETSVLGPEPLWLDANILSEDQIYSRLGKSYNWYNYFCSNEEYKTFVLEYCKKYDKDLYNLIKNISKDSFEFRSCGAIARIISLGGKVTNKEHEVLNKNLKSLKLLAEKQVSQEEQHQIVSKQNVQQNIKEKISNTINTLDCKIDEFILCEDYKLFLKSFNIETWIKNNNLKPYECSAISDYYTKSLTEKQNALDGSDTDLVEAYSFLGKIKLKKMIEMLTSIVNISSQYALQKKERKPRKKKKKSSEQLIKKLKFQLKDENLGVVSVDPRGIIGASMVVLYNTKYNKVTILESETLDGLSVKGTTIINTLSTKTKIVRKPKEFIRNLGVSVRGIRNQFDDLSTKEMEGNSRINENTIILRTIK